MNFQPNFERIKKAMGHEEPDRLPLIEALVSYEIQSQFLGRKVEAEDIPAQWTGNGWGLTVGCFCSSEYPSGFETKLRLGWPVAITSTISGGWMIDAVSQLRRCS